MKLSRLAKLFVTGMLLTSLTMTMIGCSGNNQKDKDEKEQSEDDQSGDGQEKDAASSDTPVTIDMENEVGVTINNAGLVTDEVIELLKENGITYVRIPFMYPFNSDGTTPSTSYMSNKRTAQKFYNAGIKVMAQCFWPGGMAYNSYTGNVEWVSYLPVNYDDKYFNTFAQTATEYMAKDLADICDTWLISNEIDCTTYTGAMTFEQIVSYVETCVAGVKKGNPNASCGVNMLVAVDQTRSLQFVEALYGEDSVLDWLGIDGYYATLQAGGPETWDYYIDTFYSAAQVPMVITEWSYSSAESDPLGTCKYQWKGHEKRGPQTQAEYVTACMEVFSEHPEVIGTFWYALHNQDDVCWECGNPECNLYSSWGLLNVDNSPKPSLEAMSEASKTFRAR